MAMLNKLVEAVGSADGAPVCDVLIVDCGVIDEADLESAVQDERSRRILAPVGGYKGEVDVSDSGSDEESTTPRIMDKKGEGNSTLNPPGFNLIDFGDK